MSKVHWLRVMGGAVAAFVLLYGAAYLVIRLTEVPQLFPFSFGLMGLAAGTLYYVIRWMRGVQL